VSASEREPPPSRRSLDDRIRNVARERGQAERRLQLVVANTVIGQMLPEGVFRGGAALQIRAGEARSRFTTDLDAARPANVSVDEYVEHLRGRVAAGWGNFAGTVAEDEPAKPEGVPDEYIMRPFRIRLAYRGSEWVVVKFELGHDEVGSTEKPEARISKDIVAIFAGLGLGEPQPVPVMQVEHQVAQKLHACTWVNPKTGVNDRAHDLVDLQIIEQDETIDFTLLAEVGERLFASRRAQSWPPTVVTHDGWETIYAAAADGLDVIANVDDAVTWANELIGRCASI
jgi:hypothetical protein